MTIPNWIVTALTHGGQSRSGTLDTGLGREKASGSSLRGGAAGKVRGANWVRVAAGGTQATGIGRTGRKTAPLKNEERGALRGRHPPFGAGADLTR